MPVAAFVVEHPRGTLVFDTGMHPEVIASTARLRKTAPLFDVELDQRLLLAAQLASVDIDASAVTHAAVSHLHFDHAGGLIGVPNARLLVQRDEWRAAFHPAASSSSASSTLTTSTSATNAKNSKASTMCSATARYDSSRRPATRRAINRCSSRTACSSLATRATAALPSTSTHSRRSRPTQIGSARRLPGCASGNCRASASCSRDTAQSEVAR